MIISGRFPIVHQAGVGNDGNGNRRADPGWSLADNVAWTQFRGSMRATSATGCRSVC